MQESKNKSITSYRDRIYDTYVSARAESLAPQSLQGLNSRAAYIRRVIRQHFPSRRDAKIIDLGCGHGAFIHFAYKEGFHNICGIDGSWEQIAASQQLGIPNLKHGDIFEEVAATQSDSCDVVIAFDVIEHFHRHELVTFVDEVYRILKPGGIWIVHTPNGESPFSGRALWSDFTHEVAFTRTSIAQLLYSSNFADVQSYEDDPVPHGVKSLIRWLVWKVIRGILRIYLAAEIGDTSKNAIFSQNFLTVAKK